MPNAMQTRKAQRKKIGQTAISADMTRRQPKTHLHWRIHVEELPESESIVRKPSPHLDHRPRLDKLDEGKLTSHSVRRLLVREIRATQTISQKLCQARRHLVTHFKGIVPKPYQEFQDIFAKESFDDYPLEAMGHTLKTSTYACT